jgi:quinol monooxygenase YgiN
VDGHHDEEEVRALIALIATFRAASGKRAQLLAQLREAVAATADEDGTLVYAAHASTADAESIVFYELYRDEEALAAHGKAMTRRPAPWRDLIDGKVDLVRLDPVMAKGLDAHGVPTT